MTISKATQSIAIIASAKATYLPPVVFILEVTAPRPVCHTGDDMDPGEEQW